MTAPRVIVVGGGITGLSAAFTLQEDARRIGAPLGLSVLEAAATPGGHAQTIEADGFLIEAGPNGFLNREPEMLALVEALGLGPRLVTARKEANRRFILREGRLCKVPDSPGSLVTSPALSARGKLRLLMEPFAQGPVRKQSTRSPHGASGAKRPTCWWTPRCPESPPATADSCRSTRSSRS